MPKRTLYTLCILLTSLLASSPVYAYLDPGSGSVLLQGLLAGTAGLIAVLKLYWQRFKAGFLQLKNKWFPQKTVTPTTTLPSVDRNDDSISN